MRILTHPRRALITGATSGIGEALAHLLQDRGIELLLTGRNEESLKKWQVPYFVCDLSRPHERAELFRWAVALDPDLWVNNAGFGSYGPFDEMSLQEVQAMLETNVAALTEGTLAALAHFLKKGEGTVLNVASMAAHFPFPYGALYGATKAFVYQLTRSLDAEYRQKGIRLLTSMPGVIETEFQKRAAKGRAMKRPQLSMDVQFAAKEIWHQIESKKSIHGFDWRYRLLARLQTFLPSSLSERIISNALKKR